MMTMKKTFIRFCLLILALVVVSCSKDDSINYHTELSLEEPHYILGNVVGDTVIVAIVTEGKAASTVRIPYRLSSSSNAVLHQDYELSDSAFTLNKGDSVAYLKVTRKAVSKPKSFLLTLLPVEGVKIGALNYIEVELLGQNIYSFEDKEGELGLTRDCVIRLQTARKSAFSFTKKTRLDVVVDPASTAQEGVHFRFMNDAKQAVFRAGQNTGTVTLEFLKYEKGKDHIILRLAEHTGLLPGTNPATDIRIVGPDNLSGKWSFQGITNKDWFINSWGYDPAVLIDTVQTDRMELEGTPAEGYQLTPHFEGKLKNYFIAPTKAKFVGERQSYFYEGAVGRPPKVSLTEYELEKVNVAFDKEHTNVRKALIGFRLLKTPQKEKILEVSIYDIEPTEPSWHELVVMMKYSYSEPPYMLDGPIRLHFKQIK